MVACKVLGAVMLQGSPLSSTRQRRALAALVVAHGEVVSADRLADIVWDGDPPSSMNALQTYMSRLRTVLGADSIQTRPPGYALALPIDAVDAWRFETLVDQARSIPPVEALDLLDEALGLWRGAAYAEFAHEEFARAEAVRLGELRAAAAVARLDALIGVGRADDAAADALHLIEAEPFRESVWDRRMRALHASGRTVDALRVFQDYRRLLADQLGLEPSPELVALEHALLTPQARKESTDITLGSVPWNLSLDSTALVDRVEIDPLVDGRDSGVPLPGRLGLVPAFGVVARKAETDVLLDAFSRVRDGCGREVCLVSGEAGGGKSTLVAAAARAIFDAGACVLYGHCEEDLAAPYQLFFQTLNHFVKYAPDDRLAVALGTGGANLARLLPDLSKRVPGIGSSQALDADTERYQLHAAVADLIALVSLDQPVVMVLEDLQWGDSASLQLLRHVVAADESMRLLILGTYRDSELGQTQQVLETLAALHSEHGVARLRLEGLDSAGVVSLMKAAAGHDLGDDAIPLAEAIHRETDGNPFFVTELLRHLAESEVIVQDADGRWTLARPLELAALPDTVLMVIGARVGRLGPQAGRVLSLAAVVGRDFDVDVVAIAAATSEDELLDILDAARSAALVQEMVDVSGRYNFSHALIQRTLYEGLGPTRRAQAHHQVAEALERLCAGRPEVHVAELAHHWLNAAHGSHVVKALEYSRRAADAALTALAPAEAERYYLQARDLYQRVGMDDPLLSVDLTIGLGTAQRQTGDQASRQTLLDAARRAARLGDTGRLVTAVLANNRGLFSRGGIIDTDKVELLELAIELVDAHRPDRALLLATLCSELTYAPSFEHRKRLADEADAVARQAANPAVLVRVTNCVLYSLRVPELLGWSMERSAEALELAEVMNDPVQLFWAAHNRVCTAAWACDIDEMDRCATIRDDCASRLQQPMFEWVSCYMNSLRMQISGDLDKAEHLAAQARDIANSTGEPDAMLFFYDQTMATDYQRGNLSAWITPLEEELAANPELSEFSAFAVILTSSLALGYAQDRRIDESERLLEAFASTGFQAARTAGWLSPMVRYAEVASLCNHRESAASLFDLLSPAADQVTMPGITTDGPVNHYLATLAMTLEDYEAADEYFARAAAFNQRADAKFFDARTNLWWAKMLIARNAGSDKDRAQTLLVEARANAATYGYGDVERRAAEALADFA